jgi:hypothetical protein
LTRTKLSIVVLAIGAFALGHTTLAVAQSGVSSTLKASANDAGGVRVVIKPKSIKPGAAWEFDVTMDTHTKPLDHDLTKISALVADNKDRYAPLDWQGDPPGGHHRKGVLRFPAPATSPTSFELQIEGLGAPGKRVFQWKTN